MLNDCNLESIANIDAAVILQFSLETYEGRSERIQEKSEKACLDVSGDALNMFIKVNHAPPLRFTSSKIVPISEL